MKSVLAYCQKNILVIPQALHEMEEVTLLLNAHSSVFYKCLSQDLLDVEFHSNAPCLVYIESGREVLTTGDNDHIELNENSLLLLPKGMPLHSDFVKQTHSLKAFLIFFDAGLISEFLSQFELSTLQKPTNLKPINGNDVIQHYFQSLLLLDKYQPHSFTFIQNKLLELLYLLSKFDHSFPAQLYYGNQGEGSKKRNLHRLLSSNGVLSLSIRDMAHLSGRSLSTFSRDFKALYDTTPKQWLLDKRLSKAKDLLAETDFSVTHIATELGYDNVSHFIKAFKNKYAMTPKQYKKCG